MATGTPAGGLRSPTRSVGEEALNKMRGYWRLMVRKDHREGKTIHVEE